METKNLIFGSIGDAAMHRRPFEGRHLVMNLSELPSPIRMDVRKQVGIGAKQVLNYYLVRDVCNYISLIRCRVYFCCVWFCLHRVTNAISAHR